jgi:hypothetical protein
MGGLVGWWRLHSVFVLCDGDPVGTSTGTTRTSPGLVQEHKGGPIPRGEVRGEVREGVSTLRLRKSTNFFHHLVASANIRRNNS